MNVLSMSRWSIGVAFCTWLVSGCGCANSGTSPPSSAKPAGTMVSGAPTASDDAEASADALGSSGPDDAGGSDAPDDTLVSSEPADATDSATETEARPSVEPTDHADPRDSEDITVDVALVRRAVIGKLLSPRGGKLAMEFDALRKEKQRGELSKDEVAARLNDLGIDWAEGEALIQKLIDALNTSVLANGSFEDGWETNADRWTATASHPPERSEDDAKEGVFSMHAALKNGGARPCEGLLKTSVAVVGRESYELEFWHKPIALGPSFIAQYHLQWISDRGSIRGGTGFVDYRGELNAWSKVAVDGLTAPEDTNRLEITFRFVTGAVDGGHGEVFLDAVALRPSER